MGMGIVPGGSLAHPLLSLALSYSGGLAGSSVDKIDGKYRTDDVNIEH